MAAKHSILVSASVSCMDLCNLHAAVREVEQSQVSFYHFDVVDARNICLNPSGRGKTGSRLSGGYGTG